MKKLSVSTVVVLIVTYFGISFYASSIAEERVNHALVKAADFVVVDYKNVRANLLATEIRVTDVFVTPVGRQEKIKINEIIIHEIDDSSGIPAFLSVSINGIELKQGKYGGFSKHLTSLGYTEKLLANLTINYNTSKKIKNLMCKKSG